MLKHFRERERERKEGREKMIRNPEAFLS